MAWSTPFTAVVGAVITSAGWNTSARDNLLYLRGLVPDPASSGIPLVSTSTTTAAFSQVGAAGIADAAVTDAKMATPKVTRAGDSMTGVLSVTVTAAGDVAINSRNTGASPGYGLGVLNAAGSAWDLLVDHVTAVFTVAITGTSAVFSGLCKALTFESTQATGTAPMVVASTTKVTNLNADLLDGLDSASFALASHLTGVIAAFATAAAIAAGWSRYTALDGRIPVGAGTTFTVTYVEATNYGSSWSHSHTGPSHTHTGPSHTHTGPSHTHGSTALSVAGNTGAEDTENGLGNNGGVNTPAVGHTHAVGTLDVGGSTDAAGTGATGAEGTGASGASGTGATSSDAWVIPSLAVVWAQHS